MSMDYSEVNDELLRLIESELGPSKIDECPDDEEHSLNHLMTDLNDMISMALDLEKSEESEGRQEYLYSSFAVAADACWTYIKDILHDPEVEPETAEKVIEELIKYTAFAVAMTVALKGRTVKKEKDEAIFGINEDN